MALSACSVGYALWKSSLLHLAALGGVMHGMASGCHGQACSRTSFVAKWAPWSDSVLCGIPCLWIRQEGRRPPLVMLAGARWAERQTLLGADTYSFEGEPLTFRMEGAQCSRLAKRWPVVLLKE